MNWRSVEVSSAAGAAVVLFGCAAIGFRWIATPYFRGYAATAGGLLVLSRVARALSQDGVRPEGR